MRILFFMRHAGYLRNFEWALRELAARGHRITIAFDSRKTGSSELAAYAELGAISAECPNIEFGEFIPPGTPSLISVATRRLRLIQDYLRYLDPVFSDATKLRRRSSGYLDRFSRSLVHLISKSAVMRDGLNRTLHWFDDLIPYPRLIEDCLRRMSPDIVMVTPLFGPPRMPTPFCALAIQIASYLWKVALCASTPLRFRKPFVALVPGQS